MLKGVILLQLVRELHPRCRNTPKRIGTHALRGPVDIFDFCPWHCPDHSWTLGS